MGKLRPGEGNYCFIAYYHFFIKFLKMGMCSVLGFGNTAMNRTEKPAWGCRSSGRERKPQVNKLTKLFPVIVSGIKRTDEGDGTESDGLLQSSGWVVEEGLSEKITFELRLGEGVS